MDLDFLEELEKADLYDVILENASSDAVEEIRINDNKVYGCQSNVWVYFDGSTVKYDSDSLFVKGILNLLMSSMDSVTQYQSVSIKDFSFLTPEKITFQRLKGIDSFLKKLNHITSQ